MNRQTLAKNWQLIAAVTALIIVLALIFLRPDLPSATNTPPVDSGVSVPGGSAPGQAFMTLDPRIVTNLTQYPNATALSGEAANNLTGLRALVDACPDFDAQRREQMDEQINYLLYPATLPREVLIALGADPHGRLLYVLANLTKVQWQLLKSPASSCLVPIGQHLNQLLVADNQPPIPEFTGG